MDIVLAEGRRIQMQSLEQHFTYAGVLCGRFSAADHDRRIEKFLQQARARLEWLGDVCPLPPVRTPLPFKPGSSAPVAERLPAVVCVAEFLGGEPVRDAGEMYSSAAFLWFQDAFGLPDAKAVQAIRATEWAKVARDWSM
ncbi:MAG: hypothetical protein FIB01_01155 [Gemmatimonadetes bacterium]|nr:hypothetical protein [Gemmatimonadota bacterium]